MFRNYLKIAFRSLIKQRVYTIINVLGLSVGIASCLLIVMFVRDEFSYDKFHSNADNIYKVVLERKYPNHATNYAITTFTRLSLSASIPITQPIMQSFRIHTRM
jgi:putative ABC transport system permease protein